MGISRLLGGPRRAQGEKTHKINLLHYIPDFFIKTFYFRLKFYLVFSHSMGYVTMNFWEKILKSVEVLEKNAMTFLCNKTCYGHFLCPSW